VCAVKLHLFAAALTELVTELFSDVAAKPRISPEMIDDATAASVTPSTGLGAQGSPQPNMAALFEGIPSDQVYSAIAQVQVTMIIIFLNPADAHVSNMLRRWLTRGLTPWSKPVPLLYTRILPLQVSAE
jgi:hypothetical protein